MIDLTCIMLDIVPMDSVISVVKPMNGEMYRIQCRVKNIGDVKEYGGFNVLVKVDEEIVGTLRFGDIGAGYYSTQYLQYAYYRTNGPAPITSIEIDPEGVVVESDKTNNTKAIFRYVYSAPSGMISHENKNDTGADVVITPVNGYPGVVSAVEVRAYSDANGKDDYIITPATYDSIRNVYIARVNLSDHNNWFGAYSYDIKVTDDCGIVGWTYGGTTYIDDPTVASITNDQSSAYPSIVSGSKLNPQMTYFYLNANKEKIADLIAEPNVDGTYTLTINEATRTSALPTINAGTQYFITEARSALGAVIKQANQSCIG